ncbi:histidine kinase N-terminal 7TM domain-containing protein [Paradesulfitobacterium aromaticivorans]
MASALISLSLGIYALVKRRNVKGSTYFILLMILVAIWTSGNALEMSSTDFSTKLFWANIQYIAYGYSPVILLALCMEFSGYDRWIRNKKFLLWIAVIPTIIILLVWTDRLYGLVRYDIHMDYSGAFPVLEKEYGPVFLVHALYAHLLNISAWVLLIVAVFFKKSVYRKQAMALFIGLSLTLIPNILYVLGLSPVKRFDITAALFGPANLIIAFGIYRFKLFDVVPVARATVIETMDAGVMVLDLQDRVLDINPAFEKIVGYPVARIISKTVKEVCVKIPELVNACVDRSIAQREFSININGVSKVYELFISPLTDSKGTLIGRLIVNYDITEKKQAHQEYLKQQWKLAVTEERERQARDMHDNLGQVLGFINLQAQGIRQELMNAGVEIASPKLNKLVEATQSAHNEIREYIRNARSTASMEMDFMTALTKDILSFEEQTGLKVRLDIPLGFAGEEVKPNLRFNILNILKEALNNIRKHAEAANVRISFSLAREQLCATVEDDGKGFDMELHDNTNKTKFGLKIMRERASEIGAQIDIKSIIGKGSRIDLFVPIKEREGD